MVVPADSPNTQKVEQKDEPEARPSSAASLDCKDNLYIFIFLF